MKKILGVVIAAALTLMQMPVFAANGDLVSGQDILLSGTDAKTVTVYDFSAMSQTEFDGLKKAGNVSLENGALKLEKITENASVDLAMGNPGVRYQLNIKIRIDQGTAVNSYAWITFGNGSGKQGAKFRPSTGLDFGYKTGDNITASSECISQESGEKYYDYLVDVNGTAVTYYGKPETDESYIQLASTAIGNVAENVSSPYLQLLWECGGTAYVKSVKLVKYVISDSSLLYPEYAYNNGYAWMDIAYPNNAANAGGMTIECDEAKLTSVNASDSGSTAENWATYKSDLPYMKGAFAVKFKMRYTGAPGDTILRVFDAEGYRVDVRFTSIGINYRSGGCYSSNLTAYAPVLDTKYEYIMTVDKEHVYNIYRRAEGEDSYSLIVEGAKADKQNTKGQVLVTMNAGGSAGSTLVISELKVTAPCKCDKYTADNELYLDSSFSDNYLNEGWELAGEFKNQNLQVSGDGMTISAGSEATGRTGSLRKKLTKTTDGSYAVVFEATVTKGELGFDLRGNGSRSTLLLKENTITVRRGEKGNIDALKHPLSAGKAYTYLVTVNGEGDVPYGALYMKDAQAKQFELVTSWQLSAISNQPDRVHIYAEGDGAIAAKVKYIKVFDGAVVTDAKFNEDGAAQVKICTSNISNPDSGIDVILAEYGTDGLTNVDVKPVKPEVLAEVSTETAEAKGNAKLFVWNSVSGMKPMTVGINK